MSRAKEVAKLRRSSREAFSTATCCNRSASCCTCWKTESSSSEISSFESEFACPPRLSSAWRIRLARRARSSFKLRQSALILSTCAAALDASDSESRRLSSSLWRAVSTSVKRQACAA
jgi:hypothetical protein